MIEELKIGSRDSKLALIQSNWVRDKLLEAYPELKIEIVEIKTQGDKILDVALSKIGDKALFTKELENELLAESIDLAVHSMKDLPTSLPDGLEIAVTTEREDIRDVICFSQDAKERGIDSLDKAEVIASSSLRRKAQLQALYPQAKFVDIRGNVPTRLLKLDDPANSIDALVLAAAGLNRLGLEERIDLYLEADQVYPAVGQGALAVEIKSGREELRELLRKVLNSEQDEAMVKAERSFLARLEGGCQIPIGVSSSINGREIHLKAIITNLDGSKIIKAEKAGSVSSPKELGLSLADEMISQGADEILKQIRLAI